MSIVEDSALVEAQKGLIADLQERGSTSIAGAPASRPEFFADLQALLFIARNGGKGGQSSALDYSGEGQGIPGSVGKPILRHRGDIATYLPAAWRAAKHLSRDDLVEWLRESGHSSFEREGIRLPPIHRFPQSSEAFQACLREAAGRVGYTNTTAKLGFDHRRHRRPADLDARFESRHVPQLFWKSDFDEVLSGYFCGVSSDRARRICSALLVRLIEPVTWSDADQVLGYSPDLVSAAGTSVEFSRISREGLDKDLIAAVKAVANRRAGAGPLSDYQVLRDQLSTWSGIDAVTWRYLLPGRVPKLSHYSDSPVRRKLASAWVWGEVTSGDVRLVPGGLGRSTYKHNLFVRGFMAKIEERLKILADLIRQSPATDQATMRGMLIGELIGRGLISPRTSNVHLDSSLAERVLRFVSDDSGIDRETMLAGSRSADVREARHLAASLIKIVAGCSWTPIGKLFRTRGNSTSIRSMGPEMHVDPIRADRHRDLLEQIRDGSAIAPSFAGVPHRKRMEDVADGIREAAALQFEDMNPRSVGSRVSQMICREMTDLSWGYIYRLHGETNQLGSREFTQMKVAMSKDPELKVKEAAMRSSVQTRAPGLLRTPNDSR